MIHKDGSSSLGAGCNGYATAAIGTKRWHLALNSSEICWTHSLNLIDLILKGLPDLKSLRELMSNYNTRNFRYEEDMIPGISGLLSLFSRSFQSGFLCGLPEMFFDS